MKRRRRGVGKSRFDNDIRQCFSDGRAECVRLSNSFFPTSPKRGAYGRVYGFLGERSRRRVEEGGGRWTDSRRIRRSSSSGTFFGKGQSWRRDLSCALANGKLAVMARLPVDRVEPAFEYQLRETGLVRGAIVPKGVRPRTNESNQAPTCSFAPHQKPITCCSESAASGNGSSIEPRIMPDEFVPRLLFGPSDDSLKSLRFDKNGKLSVVSFSGYVRRMSPETLEIFESLFA